MTWTESPIAQTDAFNSAEKTAIREELERILKSAPFRNSSRSRQFLSYAVLQSLEGHTELLKERTIGVELFQRDPDYGTGDDPVVRVQAGEVRRRLEKYYQSEPSGSSVHIEIPLGSYVPQFRFSTAPNPVQIPVEPETQRLVSSWTEPQGEHALKTKGARAVVWVATACCIALLAFWGFVGLHVRQVKPSRSTLDLFWSPAISSSRPVLICLAKPVVYRPSVDLYEKYARAHPGTFQTEPERDNIELPLDPGTKIEWKDIEVYPGYGVASGDVYAAVSISMLLTQKGKPSQVRIGNNYSFEDLRGSPAVVIGAFNNRWTMETTSNLHFAFVWGVGIREQVPSGRVWTPQIESHSRYKSDFGVVTRLVDSKTGQFLIATAGLGTAGTQAAAELISNQQYLQDGLQKAPADWNTKNLQLVVQTNVLDGVPEPPRVVAAYFW